jgi:hypothetical protein
MPPKPQPKEIVAAELQGPWNRWKWIFDPIPPWVLVNPEQWKAFVGLEAKFAVRQIELEQKALDIEKERISALGQFYAGK